MALPLLLIAFLLGIKHSYDADHLVAVSTYLTRARTTRAAVSVSLHWALGHMITASVITIVLFTFKDLLLSSYLSALESVVGVMLVVIGLLALKGLTKIHAHPHSHGRGRHAHFHPAAGTHHHQHMFGIGVVHGLASNDELLVLLTISIGFTSLFGLLLGIVVFSLGVVAGMLLFSTLVGYPAAKWGNRIRALLVGGSGIVSIAYGALLLAGVV